MDDITDVTIAPITSSRFMQPYRVTFKQDGVQKDWDVIRSHDSVAILIHNVQRQVAPPDWATTSSLLIGPSG